ncbi:MAG: DUF5685 family protein [Candidatus Eremiobacterota bacterium]
MFGDLGIQQDLLTCAQRREYMTHFCGACHLMAEFGGRPAALWMNYDLTFLAMLLSGLEAPGPPPRLRPCTAVPWRSVRVAHLPPWGREALAAIHLALVRAKLEDDCRDEGGLLKRVARAWVRGYAPAVRRALSVFLLKSIEGLPDRQHRVEQTSRDLDELARPTAGAVGDILAHTAELSGREELRGELRLLGERLGRFLYLLDAARDRAEDRRRGRFNALDRAGVRDPEPLLRATLDDLRAALEPFRALPGLDTLGGPLLASLERRASLGPADCDCGDCANCCDSAPGCNCGDCCRCGDTSPGCDGCKCCDACPGDCCCDCDTSSKTRPDTGPPSSMTCPSCGAGLKARPAGPVDVDVCTACGGVWLDRDELRTLARRRVPDWLTKVVEPTATAFVPEGQRQCPRCSRRLTVADSRGVHVDLCQACQGVWLDRGELNRLLESG